MYNRAPRLLTQAESQHHAAPGQYEHPSKPQKKDNGFAPFGAMVPRETIFEVSPFAPALPPPPGQYEVGSTVGKNVVGGSSLANKSKRFSSATTRVPPPTRYAVAKPLKGQEPPATKTHVVVRAAGFIQPRRRSARLGGTGGSSSIPARTEPWGYERDAQGNLVKRLPPRVDAADVGPGWYSPSDESHSVTQRYKGAHFSKQSAPRELKLDAPRDAPPPGTYDPTERPADVPVLVATPKHPGFNASSERVLGAPPEVVKDDVPGPSAYNVSSSLTRDSPAVVHPGFGSTSLRFHSAETVSPSPGTYAPPASAIRTPSQTTVTWMNAQRSPFLHSTPRFSNDRTLTTPGPGSYGLAEIPAGSMAAAARARAHDGLSASFGATDRRTVPLTTVEAATLPGPGAYDTPPVLGMTGSGSKRSLGSRRRAGEEKTGAGAGAGAGGGGGRGGEQATLLLDMQEMSISGRDPNVHPTVAASPKSPLHRGAFLSNSKRELQLTHPELAATPAPGAYAPPPEHAPGGKLPDHFRERFPSATTPTPAPSSYDVRAPMVKPSFNVQLMPPAQSSSPPRPAPSDVPSIVVS